MIGIILLAAGNSRRFQGENKLLVKIGAKPLCAYSFESWKEAADRVKDCLVFVVGRDAKILTAAERMGFVPVKSPDSEKGISYSIQSGIYAAARKFPNGFADTDRLVFSVSDQPFLQANTLIRFLNSAKSSPYACLSLKGKPYNPVSFSPEAIPELLSLTGDQGGKKVLRTHLGETLMVEVSSEEELKDVDFRKDLDDLSADMV